MTQVRRAIISAALKEDGVEYERDSPLTFKFKTSLNSMIEFASVNLAKRWQCHPLINLGNVQQKLFYPSRHVVTEAKKQDMLDLFPYIPPVYHSCYEHIPSLSPIRKPNNNVVSDNNNHENNDNENNDDEYNDQLLKYSIIKLVKLLFFLILLCNDILLIIFW